jgi:GNAT superfamily N-acetyltransferase
MQCMTVRLLTSGDETALEAFLVRHRDTSMFLRSNVRQAGLDYTGQPASARYLASFDGDAITGVAAHSWNGIVIMQAPGQADALARGCVETSGRSVSGLLGPPDQVRDARAALGLADAACADKPETLFALDLASLIVPELLANGEVACRPAQSEDRAVLHDWGFAYDMETLGAANTPEARRRAAEFMDMRIDANNAWVAVDREGRLLSFSSFNATLPDIVQLGGIYTPPALRGRGYAKLSVAHSLLVARDRGATRAVLFTSNPSAERAYEAVGFRRIGEYALVLFQAGRP